MQRGPEGHRKNEVRDALSVDYFETPREISERTGIPLGTVKREIQSLLRDGIADKWMAKGKGFYKLVV